MFDIRDVSDTVPGSFDYHVARGMIQVQMAFGLAPRSAGRMKKPLVKVRLASVASRIRRAFASSIGILRSLAKSADPASH
jgi:hypothetical protein